MREENTSQGPKMLYIIRTCITKFVEYRQTVPYIEMHKNFHILQIHKNINRNENVKARSLTHLHEFKL